jgi:hypothetical protein
LKGKDKEWNWGEEQQKAFKEIKTAIISELVLVLPRDEGKFKVETDALNFGIGAIQNDGVIYRNGRIYVLNSQEIHNHILHNHHYL